MDKGDYEAIHMPKNTSGGVYIGLFSFLLGFGMVWHMFWLAGLSVVGVFGTIIYRLYEKETDYFVSVETIKEIEGA